MTFDAIAYGPEEHLLVTFDGAALLAHDAQTEAPKWALDLPAPIAAVLYADLDTFPASQASPWRSNASSRWVVAVDVTGGVHVVDAAVGQLSMSLGPFGPPTAVAAGAGGRFALSTANRIHVWRSGERTEIPDRAAALAFSNDGTSLAIGGGDGSLRFVSVATGHTPLETFCAVVHGGINDLVQHPSGTWVVAGRAGMFTVSDAGPQRLTNMPATTSRVRFDARGVNLAAQLSERSVAVYAWPRLEVQARIEYIERPVRGLAFGPANWLGVGLDHGDGNKIDIVTTSTHRTDTHPGRVHRSWMLSVRGKETILSAREADDVRRMKDPFHVPAPPKGNGGRVGIGVGVGVALMLVRVILTLGGSSHSSYAPSYTSPYSTSGLYGSAATKCDVSCAKTRLGYLQVRCANDSECTSATADTLAALRTNDCASATSSFARITRFGQTGTTPDPLDSATFTVAKTGLEEACSGAVGNGSFGSGATSEHAMLIKLEGPDMEVTAEDLPQTSSAGEKAERLWAAPDGTLFASTLNNSRTNAALLKRDADSGTWTKIGGRRTRRVVEIAGKTAQSLSFMDQDSMGMYDGNGTKEITPPSGSLFAIATSGDDLLVVGEGPPLPKKPAAPNPKKNDDDDDDDVTDVVGTPLPPNVVYRRQLSLPDAKSKASDWKIEPTVASAELESLYMGPGSVWAVGSNTKDKYKSSRLYERSTGGKWVERRWWGSGTMPSDEMIQTVWVTPTNDAFVGTNSGVYRSTGAGVTFTKTPDPQSIVGIPHGLWGRSATDVFAATADGILHYDGKAWSYTPYRHDASAVTGTKTDVYALTTSR